MRRLAILLGLMGGTAFFAAGCGDDSESDLSSGGKAGSAGAGASSGGSSGSTGKGGTSTGGSATGGKGGSGGATTGGSSSGGTSGSAPTGGDGNVGGNGGAPSGGAGGNPGGGAGGSDVIGSPPVATINHPGDGEMRDVGDPIPFVGVGTDAEDGMLTGGALVWTSSREGQIGTGQNFNASLSEAGMHVITLTVTDSDGNQATDTITLDMQ